MSSYLASVLTPGENNFINVVMKLNLTVKTPLDPPVFLGLHDISVENGWEWTDNSLVKYVNWAKNQPDDWHGEVRYLNKFYIFKSQLFMIRLRLGDD